MGNFGDLWLLTWRSWWLLIGKTKGQFWNNLPKQYLVHKKNNSMVINGQSLYSSLFGFDSHITFKWGSRNITFPIKNIKLIFN